MRIRNKNDVIVCIDHVQTWLEGFSRGADDDAVYELVCQLVRVTEWIEINVKD